MSYRTRDGSWVIPTNQVQEFMTKPIDYQKLVNDCMQEQSQPKLSLSAKKSKPAKKKSSYSKTFTIEV